MAFNNETQPHPDDNVSSAGSEKYFSPYNSDDQSSFLRSSIFRRTTTLFSTPPEKTGSLTDSDDAESDNDDACSTGHGKVVKGVEPGYSMRRRTALNQTPLAAYPRQQQLYSDVARSSASSRVGSVASASSSTRGYLPLASRKPPAIPKTQGVSDKSHSLAEESSLGTSGKSQADFSELGQHSSLQYASVPGRGLGIHRSKISQLWTPPQSSSPTIERSSSKPVGQSKTSGEHSIAEKVQQHSVFKRQPPISRPVPSKLSLQSPQTEQNDNDDIKLSREYLQDLRLNSEPDLPEPSNRLFGNSHATVDRRHLAGQWWNAPRSDECPEPGEGCLLCFPAPTGSSVRGNDNRDSLNYPVRENQNSRIESNPWRRNARIDGLSQYHLTGPMGSFTAAPRVFSNESTCVGEHDQDRGNTQTLDPSSISLIIESNESSDLSILGFSGGNGLMAPGNVAQRRFQPSDSAAIQDTGRRNAFSVPQESSLPLFSSSFHFPKNGRERSNSDCSTLNQAVSPGQAFPPGWPNSFASAADCIEAYRLGMLNQKSSGLGDEMKQSLEQAIAKERDELSARETELREEANSRQHYENVLRAGIPGLSTSPSRVPASRIFESRERFENLQVRPFEPSVYVQNPTNTQSAYQGSVQGPVGAANFAVNSNVPSLNTALWITGLPGNISYKELLGTIRSCGRIFTCYINKPTGQHTTSAAKVAFFDQAGAAALFNQIRSGTFVLQNHRPRVDWNRHAYAPSPNSYGHSRVLLISGPVEIVNADTLLEYFSKLFWYHYLEIMPLKPGSMIWEFGSYHAQAQSAKLAIDREPFFEGKVKVEFLRDPCQDPPGVAGYSKQ